MSRVILPIEGMHCAGCAATIEKRLTATPGVREAAVNLATRKATVEHDGPQSALVDAVREAGYDVATDTITVPIEDLRHVLNTGRLEAEVGAVPGVLEARANPAAESLRVTLIPGVASMDDITRAIAAGGFVVQA